MTSVQPLGRRDGLGIEFLHVAHDSINHAYIMKRSMNSRRGGLTKLPRWAMYIHITRNSSPGGIKVSCLGPFQTSPYESILLAGLYLYPF